MVYRKKRTTTRRKTTRTRRTTARRIPRSIRGNAPERASCSENLTLLNGVVNTMYANRAFQLADFARASAIAANYASFKITKITMKFKPLADTYIPGAGAAAVPHFYSMLDKSGAIPLNATLENLKQMGAKPRRFDDKQIAVSWRPAVLTADLTTVPAGNVAGSQYKLSPTLSTNANAGNPTVPWQPSVVDHLGIYWYVEQPNGQGNQYQVEVEVQFQFMRPLVKTTGQFNAQELAYAIKDGSPDGVQGGSDGITTPA